MAILTITEVEKLNVTLIDGAVVAAPEMPGLAEQNIVIGGGSLACNAFTKATRFVRVNTDTNCCLAFSVNSTPPTAVTNTHRLGANETGFYGVTPGGTMAVIASPT